MIALRALRSWALVAVVAGAGLAPLAAQAAADPKVDALLRASGEALGVPALTRVRTIHVRGRADVVGVAGTAEEWQDLGDGRYASYYDAGPMTGAQGYDGAHAWNRDASGVVWNDGGKVATYNAVDSVYQNRYLLWSPDRGGATVAAHGTRTEGRRRYDVLRVTPPGGVAYDLWLDKATHLPRRTVATIGTVTSVATFADYRTVAGLRIPYTQSSITNGDRSTLTVTKAEVNGPGADEALRRPSTHADDFSLPSGTTTIPFELVDNHVYLDVSIDGKGPFHFIFDTGGSNYLDSDVAKQLGLTAAGSANGMGVGAKTEAVRFATVNTLRVGDATLRKQVFVVGPVRAGFGMSSGKPVDGLIGFEVLSRFITTFDYGSKHVVLRTAPLAPPAGAATIPFVFNGQHVDIACTIAGFPGRCTVDTGSRIPLSVLSPFLAAHPSIVPPNATAVGADGFGIGGPALGRLARTTLQIGPYTFPDTITDLSAQTRGAFADPYTAGNVGAGVWKRFALTLDYGRQTMTLVPDAGFAERDTYDRSGLFLITRGGKIIVADVRPGTPAARAGIASGDVLTTVDGTDVATYGLVGMRDLLRGAPGTSLTLGVAAPDGATRTATVTLHDYV